ncbi:MAG: hypothetical protein CME06_08860 [Gemmatimonadetes bacterium]|nr:hypothetical protein [Gemmatimonadota bacterium]
MSRRHDLDRSRHLPGVWSADPRTWCGGAELGSRRPGCCCLHDHQRQWGGRRGVRGGVSIPAEHSGGCHTHGGGRGIRCSSSSPFVDHCTIAGNSSDDSGGGLYCDNSSPTLTSCAITGNSAINDGGGLYGRSSAPTLNNCTIAGNSTSEDGGGLYLSVSSPTLTNCILWANYPQEIYNYAGTLVLTYSNIYGGWFGEGNINADPRFVSYRGYDYLLRPISPCVDAGDPTVEDAIYDWHPRWPAWYPNGARSDMGAMGGPGNAGWLP